MVRVLLVPTLFWALAASTLCLAAPSLAATHGRKPAPAESHKKKPEPKGHAKGHGDTASSHSAAHGKGRHASADEDTPKSSKHGKGKAASHADEESGSDEGCAPAKPAHGRHAAHGRKPSKACTGSSHGHGAKGESGAAADCDDAPARSAHGRGRHATHARKPKHACSQEDSRDHGGRGGKIEEEDCVEVTVKGAHGKGRHGHAKVTLKCTRRMVSARLVEEPPPGPPPPPPMVVAAPGSPADIVKHSGPTPGVESTTNPDVWAQRSQAEHRPRLSASPHLTGTALLGRTEAELRQTLGMPDLARNEGDGALWTYRLPGCSLMVFMKRTDGAMKVSGAQAAPLQRGGAAVGVDTCLAASAGR